MNKLPRTFCVTLKETPLRKKAFQESAKKAGIEATMFDGILGTRMGLIAKFPNTIECPGGNVMLNERALGCNMSHFILWHVLKYLPDEEFLIFEDDALIEPDFKEKFFPIYEKLPIDWQMAYVGWIRYGNDVPSLMVSEGLSIRIPTATHAYLVKKSVLEELCNCMMPFQSNIDLTIVHRLLPKIRYYVFDPSLVEQRSYLNISDSVWTSLVYDWDTDIYGCKKNLLKDLKLLEGWYPIERNNEEVWRWSQDTFQISIPESIDSITLLCSTPIENQLTVEVGNEKSEFHLQVGNNEIIIPTNHSSIISGRTAIRFIPSERDEKNHDNRVLGICLKSVITKTGTVSIPVQIIDLSGVGPPPISFKL